MTLSLPEKSDFEHQAHQGGAKTDSLCPFTGDCRQVERVATATHEKYRMAAPITKINTATAKMIRLGRFIRACACPRDKSGLSLIVSNTSFFLVIDTSLVGKVRSGDREFLATVVAEHLGVWLIMGQLAMLQAAGRAEIFFPNQKDG